LLELATKLRSEHVVIVNDLEAE
jgi:hypothetical protein